MGGEKINWFHCAKLIFEDCYGLVFFVISQRLLSLSFFPPAHLENSETEGKIEKKKEIGGNVSHY